MGSMSNLFILPSHQIMWGFGKNLEEDFKKKLLSTREIVLKILKMVLGNQRFKILASVHLVYKNRQDRHNFQLVTEKWFNTLVH